ncbi:MAG: pyridine nucleotide-disulfide oxidoreductase/dicluster-binding protein [Bacillota bacterium]|nr:FAD-dependent oxidoreductase [Clostridia bacterium]
MESFKKQIKNCLQDEPPFCTAACPFQFDIISFISKIQRGGFNTAYRSYLNAVGFPGIVSQLCDEPCKNVCPRRITDKAVDLKLLEKAAINYARNLKPNNYNLPPKNKRIAVIGAGISGLGCALRLASKKYQVTVFEKTDRIGGHLWSLLPPEVFLTDIQQQFCYEKYELCLNTEIKSLDNLEFDAIYVATGAGGADFGLKRDEHGAFASNKPGVFLGGELCGKNIVEAIADGLHVITAIERFLKAGTMNQPEPGSGTRIKMNTDLIVPMEPVIPAQGEVYTQEEAMAEAKRCLQCSCDACIRHCDLMRYYGKYPKRIGEEVEVTVHPGTLDGNGTVATRLISTCNHCSLCKEICPQEIDTGDFLLQSHRAMREKGAMPWAYHDFWLRDMDFANGDAAALCKSSPGYSQSRYMFFPGCQLGASDPRYVTESYRFLLEHYPDTALMLSCCGAPADWAGDEPLLQDAMVKLKEKWISLGKPIAVFACPTCRQMFHKYLPEIEGQFLYDLILKLGVSPSIDAAGEIVSVFDPCTSRHEPELHQAVRELTKQAGFCLEPLRYEGKFARCCSWGGQVSIANPSYAREVIKVRIAENNHPYIAYCINCRDIFSAAGKPCYHILDVLFGLNRPRRKPPTISERRNNRVILKRKLRKEFWKEEVVKEPMENKIKLEISPQLKQKLHDQMILEIDVQSVVEYCESSGRKIVDVHTGSFIGHLVIGNMTYWVEYRQEADGRFTLLNAYSHRMKIEEA